MKFEIRDPYARSLQVELSRQTETGLTTVTPIDESVCNVYAIAHGGFAYSVGHITAALAAQICLGRQTVVVDVSSQYLCALRPPTAVTEAVLLRAGREISVYRTQIRDARGALCCVQTVTLKTVDYPESPVTTVRPTLFPAPPDTPPEPVTGLAYPRVSPHFAQRCHIYNLGPHDGGMRYGTDLYPELCNLYGALHGGVVYTLCDVAAGGHAAFLLEKRPMTVSSSIHFLRSARNGPIYAQSRLLREGRQLLFCAVDLTDGANEPVAAAEFVLQSVAFDPKLPTGRSDRRGPFGHVG